MIPLSLKSKIENHLNEQVSDIIAVYGGDINKTVKILTENSGAYFLKWNPNSPEGMFNAEAAGLQLLASAGTELEIPSVILADDDFLMMDFIEEADTGNSFEFGIQLAKLHKKTNELHGLDHSNFIGRLPQTNKYYADWMDFFIRERLEPQVKLAIDSGKLSKKHLSIFDRVMNFTYVIFPDEPPSLLHGDLWGGNYMFTMDGRASIYDPAVYYGHREMDLAMTHLFGGFDPAFYEGYNSEYPLQKGYEERFKLCNLYPILVHTNLFGGGYVSRAEQILNRFF